jgi:aldose 1-epimerase
MSYFKYKNIMELSDLVSADGVVDSCQLSNKNGMQLNILNYGATITSLKVPLKNGEIVDVVLGFDTLEAYRESFDLEAAPYFGSTVGRFAGRINEGTFNLDGKQIKLNKNDSNHALHGGRTNFSQKLWKIENIDQGENPSAILSYFSSDNEENYPGDLSVVLTYTLSEENELIIEYKANTADHTIVNLTHHSYFNLDGHGSDISEQELIVNSDKMLETTDENIPTGRFVNTANSSFDFSEPKKCPAKIDNTFVLGTREEFAASLFNNKNNLKMSVYTTQPGVHIYVGGNCFDIIKGKENVDYHSLSGICFETQNFPDAPNHDHFPNSVLKKGELYHHHTIYKFESF